MGKGKYNKKKRSASRKTQAATTKDDT